LHGDFYPILYRRRTFMPRFSLFCMNGCGFEESLYHIFFDCVTFHKICLTTLQFLYVYFALSNDAIIHVIKFVVCKCILWSQVVAFRLSSRLMFGRFGIKYRVTIILEIGKSIEQIRIHAWWWIKVKLKGFDYNLNLWWTNQLKCTGYLSYVPQRFVFFFIV